MNEKIKNVVFDVGMVLIDFCWEEQCRKLGFQDEVIEAFSVNMIHSKYWDMLDEGTIETNEAKRKFLDAMPQYETQLQLFWQNIDGVVKEYAYAKPLVKELQEKGYRVYLLSNYPLAMYEMHWPTFSFFPMVDGYVVSAPERMRKPNLAIYKLLCDRYGLDQTECLFVDDRQENVDAAIAYGMQAIRFESYEQFREQTNF